jgi:hypothetical protein
MVHEVRRVVTCHDEDGKAVVGIDAVCPHLSVRPRTGTASHLIWVGETTPTDIAGCTDRAARSIGVAPPAGGHIFRGVFEPPATEEEIAGFEAGFLSGQIPHAEGGRYFPPSHPFMHRTRSIDYAVVMQGEIDMKLDDGWIHFKAGDVLVQQGTNHAWVNRSGATCRIAFVLIDARDPLGGTAAP